MPSIKCTDMTVSLFSGGLFKTKPILKNLNFELGKGDRLALIGENGAGKSTLLKTLGGILHPSAGALEMDGDVSALFNISLGTRALSTGRKNMVMRNLLEGKSYEEIMQKLPEMIEFADIGEYIDQPMITYSAGMAMRTVFAAATMFDPEILLLDEWIGAGDLQFKRKSRKRMNELVEKSSIIVIATHRRDLAEDLCNKGMFMRNGEIVFLGGVEEAWDAYEKTVT